jgi:zinc and cadmium transporter
VAYAAADRMDVAFLVPFAAGNFLCIGASDLIPQVNRRRGASGNLMHFAAFLVGIGLLWVLRG